MGVMCNMGNIGTVGNVQCFDVQYMGVVFGLHCIAQEVGVWGAVHCTRGGVLGAEREATDE